jgi:hypothetical protein
MGFCATHNQTALPEMPTFSDGSSMVKTYHLKTLQYYIKYALQFSFVGEGLVVFLDAVLEKETV